MCARIQNKFLQILLCAGLFCLSPSILHSADFVFPSYSTYEDAVTIEHPTHRKEYYAELKDFPHNYFFSISTTTSMSFEILIPDFLDTSNSYGAIIVKQLERRGVEEVARLRPNEASWEVTNEFVTNENYRIGPTFLGTFEPGKYFIEVHTPENLGKYVLIVNNASTIGWSNLIEKYKKVLRVKEFYEKSGWSVLMSPLYYASLALILLVIFILRKTVRRKIILYFKHIINIRSDNP